jgi:hypothetical protein
MSPYESMSWPSGMMFPFISRPRLLSHLLASTSPNPSGQRAHMLIVAGAQDKLVSVSIAKRLANLYAATNVGIGTRIVLGMRNVSVLQHAFTSGVSQAGEVQADRGGVWFAEIEGPGAGHNLMRDDGWEKCARVVAAFLDE